MGEAQSEWQDINRNEQRARPVPSATIEVAGIMPLHPVLLSLRLAQYPPAMACVRAAMAAATSAVEALPLDKMLSSVEAAPWILA